MYRHAATGIGRGGEGRGQEVREEGGWGGKVWGEERRRGEKERRRGEEKRGGPMCSCSSVTETFIHEQSKTGVTVKFSILLRDGMSELITNSLPDQKQSST